MMNKLPIISLLLFFAIIATILFTINPIEIFADNKLPIPRFASIKSNEVNARQGPNIKSSINWVFIKKGEPVEIIAEYGQWRQIRDITGEGGWVHSSLLSGKKSVIIIANSTVPITKSPDYKSKIVANICSQVRCLLNKCKGTYCQIRCKNKTGWIKKKALWGV